MSKNVCGLDFGTSNSTLGVIKDGKAYFPNLQNTSSIIPSAILFKKNERLFGQDAIDEFVKDPTGRLMRYIKRILSDDILDVRTMIGYNSLSLKYVIKLFLENMKENAEKSIGNKLTSVVVGRPVHFNDKSLEKDKKTENDLKEILESIGFDQIAFQYEPIAAALNYERSVKCNENVLIVDIGGGTSDFSVVKVSPNGFLKEDRRGDVLANRGFRLGGVDFTASLNLNSIAPLFGYNTECYKYPTKKEKSSIPTAPFINLSKWSTIGEAHGHEDNFGRMTYLALEPEKIERFYKIIDKEQGYQIFMKADKAKISLSSNEITNIDLGFVEKKLKVNVKREDFEKNILKDLNKIKQEVLYTLQDSNLDAEEIDAILFTGGSSSIPALRNIVIKEFPNSKIIDADLFGSVGKGLTLEADRIFGHNNPRVLTSMATKKQDGLSI
ncbi:MAG: Hsp70 family protein [Alphaproteobacteria bacterium]|nr:Hsp70 family protein [Alphaproteobacteria bacterium]